MNVDRYIIAQYIEREHQIACIEQAIRASFRVGSGMRIGRQPVHVVAANALRTNVNNELVKLARIALDRLNVRACVSRGRKYYRGLGSVRE